jgi:hypothetical protein
VGGRFARVLSSRQLIGSISRFKNVKIDARNGSNDPQVQGEMLADVLTMGSIAAVVGTKLGVVGWSALSKTFPAEVAADVNKGFKTLGLDVSASSFDAGRQMITTLKQAGTSAADAENIASNLIKTSATLPEAISLSAGEQLIKLVPTANTPGLTNPFWITQSEFAQLAKNPANLVEKLGLPPSSQVPSFDIYVIQAKQNVTVFQSTVAKTTDVISGVSQTGGSTQTLVLNRTEFTAQLKVGTFSTGK